MLSLSLSLNMQKLVSHIPAFCEEWTTGKLNRRVKVIVSRKFQTNFYEASIDINYSPKVSLNKQVLYAVVPRIEHVMSQGNLLCHETAPRGGITKVPTT